MVHRPACRTLVVASLYCLAVATALHAEPSDELQVVERRGSVDTMGACFAAAELFEASESFYQQLFARGWPTDPRIHEATAGEAQARAWAHLEAQLLRSGSGVPLTRAPQFQRAFMSPQPSGVKYKEPQDLLRSRISRYARMANLPPKEVEELNPVVLPFAVAAPGASEAEEAPPGTWQDAEGILVPAALGQALRAEALAAREYLAEERTERLGNRDRPFLGRSALAGYRGLLALVLLDEQVHAINEWLLFDGRRFGAATKPRLYDPSFKLIYLPHRIRVTMSDRDVELDVEDPSSQLQDQASMLQGLLEVVALCQDDALWERIGKDGGSRSKAPVVDREALRSTASGLATVIFSNIIYQHFDEEIGLIAEARGRTPVRKISTRAAAWTVQALEAYRRQMEGEPLHAKALPLLRKQVALLEGLQLEDGSFAERYDESGKPEGEERPLATQSLAVSALLIGNPGGREAAPETTAAIERCYRFMEQRLFAPAHGVYRGDVSESSDLTPLGWGSSLEALRLTLTGWDDVRFLHRYRRAVRGYFRLDVQSGDHMMVAGPEAPVFIEALVLERLAGESKE